MERITQAVLIVVGLINAAPLLGIESGARLGELYGIPAPSGDLEILMRHRALLFGLVGGLIIASAFRPALRAAAVIIGLASMLGFIALALAGGGMGEQIRSVAIIDAVASVALIAVLLPGLIRRRAV